MHIRPFDWRDLPKLHAYRNETVYLNSALLLTNGPLHTWGAMLSSVLPSTGIDTLVADNPLNADAPLIGQVIHESGAAHAQLAFAAPEAELLPETLPVLSDALLAAAGERGALRVLAEADENSPLLDAFRASGYAIYTRQRIWKLSEDLHPSQDEQPKRTWRTAASQDLFNIRLLISNLVPAMVQQVEPVQLDQPRGLVYWRDGELEGYVELRYGMRGIWARPYIHPDAEESTVELAAALQTLQGRHSRPVYVCVSAYQSWMDSLLHSTGAETGPRRVLLARHLAIQRKQERVLALPGFESQPETFAFSLLE